MCSYELQISYEAIKNGNGQKCEVPKKSDIYNTRNRNKTCHLLVEPDIKDMALSCIKVSARLLSIHFIVELMQSKN